MGSSSQEFYTTYLAAVYISATWLGFVFFFFSPEVGDGLGKAKINI